MSERKGLARQRDKGDPLKPFLQSRRPADDEDASRWTCYRTEVCCAYAEVIDLQNALLEEYEAAVARLTELEPHIDWRTLEPATATPGDGES